VGFTLSYAFLRARAALVACGLAAIAIAALALVGPRVRSVPAVVGWHAAREARERLAANAPEEALELLDAIPPEAQDEHDALLQRSNAYDALGDFAHEVESTSKLLEKKSDDAFALALRCRGRLGTKDYDSALADCAKADASPTSTEWTHQSVAAVRLQIASQRHDMPTVRAQADALLASMPDRPELYLTRGFAALTLGDVAAAAEDYDRAAKGGMTADKLGGGRCTIASRLGRPDADATCDAAVSAAPSSFEICLARAQHYDLMSHYARAIAEMDRCEPLAKPEDANVLWNNRAWIEMHAGKLDAATRDVARAVEAKPSNTHTLGTRCFIEAKRGLIDQARADCSRAAEGDADDLYDRAMEHLLDGDASAALALWQELLEKKPWLAREVAPYLEIARRRTR
jgi:tetratricopeptide (TPR) repeat protein